MTLRAALILALRFYALSFVISAIAMMPSIAAITAANSLWGSLDWIWVLQVVTMLVIALFLWAISARLADRMTKGLDGPIAFQIDFEQACALAFVFLGVYFLLKGVAPLLTSLCGYLQLIGLHATEVPDRVEPAVMRDLWRAVIEFSAGLASIVGAQKWARLTVRRRQGKT